MRRLFCFIKQVFCFGAIGMACFVVDFSLMIAFTQIFVWQYMISCAVSFVLSTVLNYILSMKYVFSKSIYKKKYKEFLIFLLISIFGLFLTEVWMVFFVERMSLHYTTSKVIVSMLVMIYSFISRKLIFERTWKEMENT